MNQTKLISIIFCTAAFLVGSNCAAAVSDWQAHFDAGNTAREQGHISDAEKHFSFAIVDAEKFGPEDPRLAKSLDCLGKIYVSQNKYSMAEPLFERALQIKEKVFGAEHPDVITSLYQLAIVYLRIGKAQQQELIIKRILTINTEKRKLVQPDSAENFVNIVKGLNNEALLYVNKNEMRKAEHCLDEAIELKPDYGLGYSNRSHIRQKLGNVKGAEEDKLEAERLGAPWVDDIPYSQQK